jgi:hypothetical protein
VPREDPPVRLRERLRLEVRAAEIAQRVREGSFGEWHGAEMAGWVRAGDGREGIWPKTWRWHAGHLAAQIWEHRLEDD